MASVIYPKYKEALLSAAANTHLTANDTTDGPYCLLIDEGAYTYNSTHTYYSDATGIIGVTNGMRITTGGTAGIAAGTFTGGNLTFSTVTGNSIEALLIYRHNSGASGTWRLVSLLESDYVTGLPVTPNGGDITVSWNASGIWTL